MRRVGVEEEFLIVDAVDGHAVPLGDLLERLDDDDGLSPEMKQEHVETCTLPRISLDELAQDLTLRRASADAAARAIGARSVALATSPLPVKSTTSPGVRYEGMNERFGLTAVEQLTCACHVHVPPGIPLLLPGERINQAAIDYLRSGVDPADPTLKAIRVVREEPHRPQ
jgi:carboxylate-amine ligase